jgi:RNA recognition motif-containing protein
MEVVISNLPGTATAERLTSLFEGYGKSAGFLILNRAVGNGRTARIGYGVITPDSEGRRAIRERHLTELDGRPLMVMEYLHRSLRDERRRTEGTTSRWEGAERRGRELWLPPAAVPERRREDRRAGERRGRERRGYERRFNVHRDSGHPFREPRFNEHRVFQRRVAERRGGERRAGERRD